MPEYGSEKTRILAHFTQKELRNQWEFLIILQCKNKIIWLGLVSRVSLKYNLANLIATDDSVMAQLWKEVVCVHEVIHEDFYNKKCNSFELYKK